MRVSFLVSCFVLHWFGRMVVESVIFEADAAEVDHLLSKRRSTNLHEGEIEDCDFLWQGDGTGKF